MSCKCRMEELFQVCKFKLQLRQEKLFCFFSCWGLQSIFHAIQFFFSCQCTLDFYVSCCCSLRTSAGLTNWSHLFSNTAARRHAAVTNVPPLLHHISVSVTSKQHRRSLDRGDPSAVAMAQGRHEYWSQNLPAGSDCQRNPDFVHHLL